MSERTPLHVRVGEAAGVKDVFKLRARVERLEVGWAEEQHLLDLLERQVDALEQQVARVWPSP